VADVERPPLLVEWFGARGALLTAYGFGLVFAVGFVALLIIAANPFVDWVIAISGVLVGAVGSLAIARRRPHLFAPGKRGQFRVEWGLIGLGIFASSVASLLDYSRELLFAASGACTATLVVGIQSAWPPRKTIERWGTWQG
jgi:hypothetical protein